MRPLRRTRPKSVKRNTTAFERNCPRHPRLCKKQYRKTRASPTGLANRSNWPKWPAYASQKWDHKLFKSIESLQQERSKAREDIVMPKVIMVAKCGGKAPFEQAICLVNCTMSYHDLFAFLARACRLPLPRHWWAEESRRWKAQITPGQVYFGSSCSRAQR